MIIGGIQFEDHGYFINGVKWQVMMAGEGKPILCLHGFPDSPETFAHQAPALIQAGFKVIIPYLPGYGSSEIHSNEDYYAKDFGKDLVELLDNIGIQKVYLFGHDWGAVAGYILAAYAPDRVEKLITAAVPHLLSMMKPSLRQGWRSRYAFLFQLGQIAVRFMYRRNLKGIDWLWRYWSPTWNYTEEDIAPVKKALSPECNLSNALGYYRAIFRRGIFDKELHALLAKPLSTPTLIFIGTNDGCIGMECFNDLNKGFSYSYKVAKIPNAGHFMHRENPEEVNRHLLRFLRADEIEEESTVDALLQTA